MNSIEIIVISCIALFFTAIVVLCVVFFLKFKRIMHQLSEHGQYIDVLKSELRAVTAGAAGMGQNLSKLEQLARRLNERQDQIVHNDPDGRTHVHAIKIIRNGASVDEVVDVCGLVREEAELLVRLHRPTINYTDSEII